MRYRTRVEIVRGQLQVWTVDEEQGRAFVSIQKPGQPWELDVFLDSSIGWVPLVRTYGGWEEWCSLLEAHLAVRSRV
jgi:hypothetical protein